MKLLSPVLCIALVAAPGTAMTVAATETPGSPLGAMVERYSRLRIGESSRDAAGFRFEQGHLSLVMLEGRAATVLAGDETVGIFLSGKGKFEYTSADKIEQAVMIHNTRKATGIGPVSSAGAVTLGGEFRTALVWVRGRALSPPDGPTSTSLEKEFAEHRERFLKDASAPASHEFAMRALDGESRPYTRVEIGGGDDIVYTHDPVYDRSENLYSLRRTESSDKDLRRFLWPVSLSEQAIERDPRDPLSSRLDLTDVAVDLATTGGDTARLTVTETLVPKVPGTSVLRLSLFSEDYESKRFGMVEPRRYNLRRVTDGAGTTLPFAHQNNDLLVGLAAPARPGEPLRLTFEIDGDMLIRPSADNYWVLGWGPWIPQPELAGQSYTWQATARVKKPYVPFASGITTSRVVEGDETVIHTMMDSPDRFHIVMAGNYQFDEETREGLTIRVASYAGMNKLAIRGLTDLAFGIVKFYERFLGPFPCKEYTIIEINDYGWGQAPPGVMFITREAFDSQMDQMAWLYTQGINERFAHEIAHQYWGHAVSWPDDEEQWLSEAFAEYCAALFVKQAMGKVEYNALLATWKTGARSASDHSTIPTANRIRLPLDPNEARRRRAYLLYYKGAWLLSRLHAELGDQQFLTFLKSYQKSFRGKLGTTKHVAGLLQFMTKKDYMPFFEANFWGTGMPE